MLPVIFSFGSFVFHSLGFWLAIGVIIFVFNGWKRLKELGYEEEKVLDFLLLAIFTSLIVSRAFYIILNFSQFGLCPPCWLLFGRFPGFSFWGAVAGFWLTAFWQSKKQKWDFWRLADEMIFALLPFMIIAQAGILFDGTMLGKPTTMPWGIFFAGSMIRRQPVSFFAVLLFVLIWLYALVVERHWRGWVWCKSKEAGFLTLSVMALALLSNGSLAFLRDFPVYFFWLEALSSLLLFIFLFGLLVRRLKKA